MRYFIGIALLTIATLAIAADDGTQGVINPNIGPDVPELAQWEAQRRGAMVQEIGTIQASDIDIIADALGVPPDDSHKWYLTVVTQDNCAACERLKSDFIKSETLRAWVNVDEPLKSTMHYQVRRSEDATQRDWMKGIEPELKNGGFPAIVIQPPRNGQYGKNSTVVCVLHGYDGNADKLTERMRRAMVLYVKHLQTKRAIQHVGENAEREPEPPKKAPTPVKKLSGGATQEQGEEIISAAPPFSIPPNAVDPTRPVGPVDYPPIVNPQPLTVEQIRALIPNAPPDFILAVLQARLTDVSQMMLQWQVYQSQKNPTLPTVQPGTTPQPSAGIMQWILLLFQGGNLFALWGVYRALQKAMGRQLLISDELYNQLYRIFFPASADNPNATPPLPPNARPISSAILSTPSKTT